MDDVSFRFRPTQQELLWLLERKARGEEISMYTKDVLEKELYGAEASKEPWNVFSNVPHNKWELYDESAGKNNNTKRVVYVVTKLSQMSAKKICRSAGCGTWSGETTNKPVMDLQGGKVMGYFKQLNYTVKSKAARKASWYMHEYSLSEQVLKQPGIKSTDYVICRIVKDNSKDCKIKDSSKGTSTSSASNAKMVGRKRKDSRGDVTNHDQEDYLSGEVMGSVEFPQQEEGVVSQNNCYCNFPNNDSTSTTMVDESMSYSGYNQGVDDQQVVYQSEEGVPVQNDCYYNFPNNSTSITTVDGSMSYLNYDQSADPQVVHERDEGSQQSWSGTTSNPNIVCDVAPPLQPPPIHVDQPIYNLHQELNEMADSFLAERDPDGMMPMLFDDKESFQVEQATDTLWHFE
ncbi:OLC1v1035667C1 [Oldenlandia corymbosa var. corymbosa]|uniref:OLC1v1035667C1 n=1 Tax=Oldenlandia corymbosa var. corymbosa TaxID=529605 RepID=A0AAV1CUW3_OLDCO|nr:OLC1v1035667C1 [Oldenlandia corymbosa var. corymbosa]